MGSYAEWNLVDPDQLADLQKPADLNLHFFLICVLQDKV